MIRWRIWPRVPMSSHWEALNRSATLADWTGARIHIVHEKLCAFSALHPLLEGTRHRQSPSRPCRNISI